MSRFYEDIRLLGGTVSIGSLTSSNIDNLFEVNGNSAVYGSFSTTGLKITNGASNGYILQSDASGNATWVLPTDNAGVTGSGTTNYIPRWTATDTLSSTSSIYDNGSRVGIGTNTPSASSKLTINNPDTTTSTYGSYITVNGSNAAKVGQFILLSNTTSTENGIIIGFGAGTQRKIGVDVGGGLVVSNSDIGYQYNSTTSAQTSNHAAYFRITATSSQNTILYGELSNGNGLNYLIRSVIQGSGYTSTYGFRHSDSSTSPTKYGEDITISGNGLSTTNYGSRLSVSGANSNNFGYYSNVFGTFSTVNYGIATFVNGGSNTNYGIYSNVTGTYGSIVNYGAYILNQSDVSLSYGIRSVVTDGVQNVGIDATVGGGDVSSIGYNGLITGTATSKTGMDMNVSGASTNNYGIRVSSSGATNNYAIVTDTGESVFNESGGDYDFRIEGLTESNLFFVDASNDNIGMGTNTPDPKALLEMTSTTQGFLPPRMTTTQREAISSPPAGLLIFNTTTSKHEGYTGTTWSAFY